MLAASLQKPGHRVTRPGVQRVQHHKRRHFGAQAAVGLSRFYPTTDLVADPHQPIKVSLVTHQVGAQAGVLAGQRRHFAFELLLQHPAGDGFELVKRRRSRWQAGQKSLRQANDPHHGGSCQVFFAGKMLVQAGFGNANVERHFIDRHQVKAFFGQQAIDGDHDGVFPGQQHLRFEADFDGYGGGFRESERLDHDLF